MLVQDQTAATDFLSDCETHNCEKVEQIETHISRIFLVGNRAFKMKRAVRLPYVDFSTPDIRLKACLKEVELNSATAPGLYLGVRLIVRGLDGSLLFGEGELIEPVIEMIRFDQGALFDRIACDGRLDATLMMKTALMVARYHLSAPIIHQGSGSSNIASVLAVNTAGFATSTIFNKVELIELDSLFEEALRTNSAVLDARETRGLVRRCHGDLHLRNICLLHGEPRLFDCIEFNDQIATIDTLYDLAFLLMDLCYRQFPQYANLIMNRYLDETDDENGLALLPFFMAIRAAVRAHVIATQVEEGAGQPEQLVAEARSYFQFSRLLLFKKGPRLIVIGGFSGSGKTTVADALAASLGAPPGARILESDRIRKRMYGVSVEERLTPEAYRPAISEKVYAEMARRAVEILRSGGSVIVDAVFERLASQNLIRSASTEAGVPFEAVWLDAQPEVLRRRVSERIGGPSDAGLDILECQLAGTANVPEWRRINTEQPIESIVQQILKTEAIL